MIIGIDASRANRDNKTGTEWYSYLLIEHLKSKGKRLTRRIIKSIMKTSTKEYNTFFRIARRLNEKENNYILKLNSKAKNKKISKRKQTLMFSRYSKSRIRTSKETELNIPELEKGFRRI